MNEKTYDLLVKHYLDYPKLQAQDIFKFLFQSTFGCEHLIFDEERVLSYIKSEYYAISKLQTPKIDQLDGDYSRVYLSWLDEGLLPETLARLFCLSAKNKANGITALEQKLEIAKKLISDGIIPLNPNEFGLMLDQWRSEGFSAVHHSDNFRAEYHPAYRVIANKYAMFLPLFNEIDLLMKKGRTIVAIEGGSASGKTTLANILNDVYNCATIHTDHFFLRPEQRTASRLTEAGGNLDRERFYAEVVQSLKKNEPVIYRPFDCSTQTLSDPINVPQRKLTIIEGVYSTHPTFGNYYNLALFLDIPPDKQRKRIMKRNSLRFANRFLNEWIPMENEYFNTTDIKARCRLVIQV